MRGRHQWHVPAELQRRRRDGADHELAHVDVDRELEALDLPDRVRAIVREELALESDVRTESESGNEAETESDGNGTAPDETERETSSETRTDDTETADRDEREPDEGIPGPT